MSVLEGHGEIGHEREEGGDAGEQKPRVVRVRKPKAG